jgi:hypothetical protein
MIEDLKFYTISFTGYFQYVMDLVNPLLSFILLFVTIIYTLEKYRQLRKNKKNE